jgi:hypothetical protein
MFLLYHFDRCNTSETVFHWCYVNDLHTTHPVVCWVTTRTSTTCRRRIGSGRHTRARGTSATSARCGACPSASALCGAWLATRMSQAMRRAVAWTSTTTARAQRPPAAGEPVELRRRVPEVRCCGFSREPRWRSGWWTARFGQDGRVGRV